MPGYTKAIRPPEAYTDKLKRRQIREYGYADTVPSHYEEDHLIPLSLGGHPRDPKNLWPQPRYGEWNAARKDELERRVQKLVCSGNAPLTQIQREIATDWIAAYRKYVSK